MASQLMTARPPIAIAMRLLCLLTLTLVTVAAGIFPGDAQAKEVVASFEADGGGIAVNTTGAGPANKGDIYVLGGFGLNRIERFATNENGTPTEPYDDSFPFLSAWGAGVQSGGSNYEICTVRSECKLGAAETGGNGTVAGDGALRDPNAIAVDQDTGDVYVADSFNRRVNVYAGDGTFLRSFGWDVVGSGPDNTGTGFEVCVAANGDVCKVGLSGAGAGQIGGGSFAGVAEGIAVSPPDGNPATGTVFLSDTFNHRVNTYNLDGTSPSSFGSSANFGSLAPSAIAVDSRGIVYIGNNGEIDRYDSLNANGGGAGFLAPIATPVDERQQVTVNATAGQFKLTFGAKTTPDLPFNATAAEVQQALRALPSIGSPNVEVDNASGTAPYHINFVKALGGQDVEQIAVSDGTTPLSGGSGATAATITPGHGGPLQGAPVDFEVHPDSDGAGPDKDVLYVLPQTPGTAATVQQFGPLNQPGLTAPPGAVDAVHGSIIGFHSPLALGLDDSGGRLFVSATSADFGSANGGIYVLADTTTGPPSGSLDSLSDITATSVTLHGTVNPNGPPDVTYTIEYSLDGSKWEKSAPIPVGRQATPQAVEATLSPGPGLEPATLYHVRLLVSKEFAPTITTAEKTFTTLPAPPQAETTGSPLRTSTTAQLSGRVNPRNAATTYSFEYIDDASYQANLAASQPPFAGALSTAPRPAGSDDLIHLVSEPVEGLQPGATYHYRLLADNGNPGSPVLGEDMTLTTPASDAPLSHGHFPGPPGSDRAWEQVSLPNSGGNPVGFAAGFSANGDRALYQIFGGAPITDVGSLLNFLFAERTPEGWQTKTINPPRGELSGRLWEVPAATSDLSSVFDTNWGDDGTVSGTSQASFWSMRPGGAATKLLGISPPNAYVNGGVLDATGLSTDGTLAVALLQGDFDPAYPAATTIPSLYDISSATPQLVSLLPGNEVPACGVYSGQNPFSLPVQSTRWVSADGGLVFFPSSGNGCNTSPELYMRDLGAEVTKLISGPPVSGPSCGAAFLRSTPGAAFFWSQSRLVAEDTAPGNCASGSDGDVYRYDIGGETLECVTCVVPGLDANVRVELSAIGSGPREVAVSEDGSRVYFKTETRLLPGAPEDGEWAAYRVDVGSGELAYVAPLGEGESVGSFSGQGNAITPDGSVLVFRSKEQALNPLGGTDNGSTYQYYRYDDRDRSLTCVSCPPSGDAPRDNVPIVAVAGDAPELGATPLSADGETFAFATPTPLLGADQNTPGPGGESAEGTDVYEWRDGRLLLITDGLTNWSREAEPRVSGVSSPPSGPEGRDVFFTTAAQLTPDAIDAYRRLYDARIGGGIEFPAPPKPCPLEVCQGTPRGAPEERAPGTSVFSGSGNVQPRKRHHKARHHHHRRSHRNRRTHR